MDVSKERIHLQKILPTVGERRRVFLPPGMESKEFILWTPPYSEANGGLYCDEPLEIIAAHLIECELTLINDAPLPDSRELALKEKRIISKTDLAYEANILQAEPFLDACGQ